MTPFSVNVNLEDGTIPDATVVQRRFLSDMKGLYFDKDAEDALSQENPLVYEVHLAFDGEAQEGQLGYSTTIIQAGTVGQECFMTKGHYHAKGDRAELYYGLKGEGMLLMQTPDGQVNKQIMTAGVAAYVPPYWGHRTINTGDKPFVFLAVYPADAGYDYDTIKEKGFAEFIIKKNGQAVSIPNPKWG